MKIRIMSLVFLSGLLLFLSACTTQTKQHIHADGSAVVKQEIDIYEYMKETLASQWTEEHEAGGHTLEETALSSAILQAEEMCTNLRNAEDDFEPKNILSACETTKDGKVILYSIFAPNYVSFNKKEGFYEYKVMDFYEENHVESQGLGQKSNITLFFDNEILYSDIGTVAGNKVIINQSDVYDKDIESSIIKVKAVNSQEKREKSVSIFNIELTQDTTSGKLLEYSINKIINRQELSPYFDSIEQIWGLSVSELQQQICPQYLSTASSSDIYIPKIQKVTCDLKDNIISVETYLSGVGGVVPGGGAFSEHADYYVAPLIRVISMDYSTFDEQDFKDYVLIDYPDNSEFHLFFNHEIIATDLGEKDVNKLILSWDDLQKINKNSSVKLSKNKLVDALKPGIINKNDVFQSVNKLENVANQYSINNQKMYSNLKGKIVLKVETKGEAYYINPTSQKMHFLGRPNDAFSVMREQGVGISNVNLAKIPVAISNLSGPDDDGDGLPDSLEIALGTNLHSADSDSDGHNDDTELLLGYNPLGSGRLSYDLNFTKSQAGKIFIQVEKNGEAWYVSPADNKRYFLSRPADAFSVMRGLGLGISNDNFEKLK